MSKKGQVARKTSPSAAETRLVVLDGEGEEEPGDKKDRLCSPAEQHDLGEKYNNQQGEK